jgi:hypothetical protein
MHQTAGKGLNVVGAKRFLQGSFIYTKLVLAFVQFFISVAQHASASFANSTWMYQ